MVTIPFSCLVNECTGWSVLAALSVLLNILMRHLFSAVSQLPSPVFTVSIIFFKQSFTVCFVCFFRVARSSPLWWSEPVWLVSIESSCRLSTVSLGRMSWTYSFSPDSQRRSHLPPTTSLSKRGCGTGGASPSLQHSTTSPQCQTGSHSVTPCGKAVCTLNPLCQKAERQSRLFTLTIHTTNLEIQAPYTGSNVTTPPQGLQSAGAISVFPSFFMPW